HAGIRHLVCDLNALYTSERALHAGDAGEFGLHWVLGDDAERSLYAFVRRDPADAARAVLVVWNTTPTVHHDVRLGVPAAGRWVELLNTDAAAYDGRAIGNLGGVTALDEGSHGQPHSISVSVGPLATLILAPEPAR
ncbi:MAG: alpha amylase C-terminal domain-containing protein, partial [Actinomycetota bacterium]|nr:alpha amylase C-terminal domain-containing protein [Actinomycetota bacterium]